MRVYKQLVKTFLTSTEVENPRQKNQKAFYTVLGIISVCFIMIPCVLLVGYLTYALSFGLDKSPVGVTFLIHFIALFSVAFGISVILNVFYFAGDIPLVLPLPIPAHKIIAAKFTAAYISESVMQFMVLVAIAVGYMLGAGFSLWRVIVGAIGVITIPIAPLTYCGILCIVLMGVTRFIRNKTHVRRFMMFFALIIVVVSLSMVGLLKEVDFEGFANELNSGGLLFMNIMNIVFPGNYWFGEALSGSYTALLFYVLYHVFLLALFLVVAQTLYLKGVVAILSGGDGVRSGKHKAMKARKPERSYLIKELRTLLRTPAFVLNCVFVNFLWPLLFYVVYTMQSGSSAMLKFKALYQTGNEGTRWLVTLAVVSVTALLTAMNSLGSSGITREGKYYYAMKYLPISYAKQLHIKAFVSILISTSFVWLYIVAASIAFDIDNAVSWYYMLVSLLVIVYITYRGLYLDTVNPKLNWDDELNALRGNVNVFFNMADAMLNAAILVLVFYYFYEFTKIPLTAIQLMLAVVLLFADYIIIQFTIKRGTANIEELY